MSTIQKVLASEILARKHGLPDYADELRKLLTGLLFPCRQDVRIIDEDHDHVVYQLGYHGDWHSLQIA